MGLRLPALALLATAATQVFAQGTVEPPATQTEPTERTGRARFLDPDDGQLDLSYFLENPRGFLPIPIVITEPAVGYGGGAAGLFLRPHKEAGAEGWARPDISGVGGFATQNGAWAAFAGDASRWLDGRLRTLVGAGVGRANLDFYGLGFERARFDRAIRYSLDFCAAMAQANSQLAPDSRPGSWACATSTPA